MAIADSSIADSSTAGAPTPATATKLPEAFADLQHLIPEFALETEEQRFRKLHSIDYPTLVAFYHEMLPRLPAILDYLGTRRLSGLAPSDKLLFDLAMTMVETSHPMELGWGATDFPGAYRWNAFEFATISTQSRARMEDLS